MEAALAALAEPHRRQILELVRLQELPAGQIAAHFEVSRPAVSQHIRVLLEAGLLTERREGTRRLYRVRPAGFAALLAFIESFAVERSAGPADPPPSPQPVRTYDRPELDAADC